MARSLALALGSMMLPLGVLFMSHAIAASLVGMAFAVAVATAREAVAARSSSALIVGSLLGLSMLCEYQAVFGVALVSGYFLWGVERRGRAVLALALTSLPFIAVLACLSLGALRLAISHRLRVFGRSGESPRDHGHRRVLRTSLAQLFVRPDNGLLLLSPWVVLAVVGGVSIACRAETRARVGREALVAAGVAPRLLRLRRLARAGVRRGRMVSGAAVHRRRDAVLAWLSAAGLRREPTRPAARVVALI